MILSLGLMLVGQREPPSSPAGRASCAPRLVLAGSGSCAGTGCSATGWAAGCPTGRVAAGCCPGVFATPCLSPAEETSPKDESAQPTELKLPREDRGEESVSGRGSLVPESDPEGIMRTHYIGCYPGNGNEGP